MEDKGQTGERAFCSRGNKMSLRADTYVVEREGALLRGNKRH